MTWTILAASSPDYQYDRYPLLPAAWIMLLIGILWNVAAFTTWYQIDPTGIHRHSYFMKKKEILWGEVTWVSTDENDATKNNVIIVVGNKARFEFNPVVWSGLPYLASCLKTKVPNYELIDAERQVDSLSHDYKMIRKGESKHWIEFKYYSPFLIMITIFCGGMTLQAPITGKVPWNDASIGMAIAIPVIVGLLAYLRKRDAS